jgi:L-2-hydroxyglutarate oxidase LhgO
MIDRIVHSEEILCRKKRFHAPYLPDNFAKGNYFKLIGKNSKPFKHLIYPIPEVGGLGVHATLDLQGNVRFGPDVEWIPAIRYEVRLNYSSFMTFFTDLFTQVNEHKAHIFAERIKPYWPDVRVENLVGDYSGIRPKIAFEDRIYEDFLIEV